MSEEPWPPAIMHSFSRATHHNSGILYDPESAFIAPFNRLLWLLFGDSTGPYDITPPWRSPYSSYEDAYTSPFLVELTSAAAPVFFVDVQPAHAFKVHSSRKQADDHMRMYMRNYYQIVITPCLHGVSAFGSRLRFYNLSRATGMLDSAKILPDQVLLNDLAPRALWDCDLLEPDGAARFRGVVDSVLEMCQSLKEV